LCDTIVTP